MALPRRQAGSQLRSQQMPFQAFPRQPDAQKSLRDQADSRSGRHESYTVPPPPRSVLRLPSRPFVIFPTHKKANPRILYTYQRPATASRTKYFNDIRGNAGELKRAADSSVDKFELFVPDGTQ